MKATACGKILGACPCFASGMMDQLIILNQLMLAPVLVLVKLSFFVFGVRDSHVFCFHLVNYLPLLCRQPDNAKLSQ